MTRALAGVMRTRERFASPRRWNSISPNTRRFFGAGLKTLAHRYCCRNEQDGDVTSTETIIVAVKTNSVPIPRARTWRRLFVSPRIEAIGRCRELTGDVK
jgi:hypothetical protein